MLCIVAVLLASGCSKASVTEKLDIEMKSKEEQMEQQENFTYDDYREILEQVVADAEKLEIQDDLLHKWVIRILAEEALYMATDLTEDQVIQLAKERMKAHTAWADYAIKKYNVTIDEEKLDKYINKTADTSDITAHHAYADALGLTLQELNHEFDRNLYERYVIWEQLHPKMVKKYGTTDERKLLEKYQEEVNEHVK